jgi:hypothetical protein
MRFARIADVWAAYAWLMAGDDGWCVKEPEVSGEDNGLGRWRRGVEAWRCETSTLQWNGRTGRCEGELWAVKETSTTRRPECSLER